MTAPTETLDPAPLPVRYCHGCGQWDDHPRATVIANHANPAPDQLMHYDCLPAEVAEQHPLIGPALAACAAGKRGQDVRDVMAAHAASITEAPADVASLHAQRAELDDTIAALTTDQEG